MEEVDFHRQVRQNQGGVSPLALYFMLPCALSYMQPRPCQKRIS